MLTAEGVSKSFGDQHVLRGLSLDVGPRRPHRAGRRRMASGKSTLLRLLAGIEPPDRGKIVLAETSPSATTRRTSRRRWTRSRTVVDEVLAHAPTGWGVESVRGLLARFLFTQDDVFKLIGALSGGEKSRLSLAKLLLKPRQLLLLDEPTNHLDVPSKDELEKALNDYAGAVDLLVPRSLPAGSRGDEGRRARRWQAAHLPRRLDRLSRSQGRAAPGAGPTKQRQRRLGR